MKRLPYYVHRYVIKDDSNGAEMFVDASGSNAVAKRLQHLTLAIHEHFPKGFTSIIDLGRVRIDPVN